MSRASRRRVDAGIGCRRRLAHKADNRFIVVKWFYMFFRGVAQSGRVLALGARCRRFKSYRPDQYLEAVKEGGFFYQPDIFISQTLRFRTVILKTNLLRRPYRLSQIPLLFNNLAGYPSILFGITTKKLRQYTKKCLNDIYHKKDCSG